MVVCEPASAPSTQARIGKYYRDVVCKTRISGSHSQQAAAALALIPYVATDSQLFALVRKIGMHTHGEPGG